MDYQKCSTESTDKNIVVSENRAKFTLQNRSAKKVTTVTVDGCLITDNNKLKCDYLFEVESDKRQEVIFVELKGKNVDHAIDQIESTITETKVRYKTFSKISFVVCRSVPKMRGTLQMRKRKHLSHFQSKLQVSSGSQGSHSI